MIRGPVDAGPLTRIALGDVDNDGDRDIVASYYQVVFQQGEVGYVGVLRNQGNGTFGPWKSWSGLYNWSLTLSDMNNDGAQDIVLAEKFKPKILIRLSDGNGDFSSSLTINVAPAIPYTVAKTIAADLNNDDYRDLVLVGDSGGKVFTSLNSGGNSFGSLVDVGMTMSLSDDLESVDLNADGRADLVFTTKATDTITVRLGNGNGSFGSAVSYAGVDAVNSLHLRDVNADAKIDMIASNGTDTMVRFNLGNGSFGAPSTYLGGSANLGDLNGDGFFDILGSTTLFNNGNGTFVAQTMDYVPHEDAAIGDINGDGLTDFVRMTLGGGAVTVLPNLGNGSFNRPYLPFDVNVVNRDHMVFVDLNGDNLVDLATIEPSASKITVKMNLGNLNFAPAVDYPTGMPASNALAVIEGADMNGDGHNDLAISVDTQVLVYLNTGTGTFAPAVAYTGGKMNEQCASIGDFNGDGHLDMARLVAAPSENSLEVMMNQGNGTLLPGLQFATVSSSNRDLVARDLNGDGYSDFVVHGTSENVSIFLNDGVGAAFYQPQPIEAFGWSISQIVVADINGDSYQDVAFWGSQSSFSDHAQISLNDGHGVFRNGGSALYGVSTVVDIDSNGFLDFVAKDSGLLCISLSNGVAQVGCYETKIAYPDTADLDGDGIPELITPNGALHKLTCSP